MNTANSTSLDDLLRRICAEYTEMPGLRVTHHQAQRLWGLDESTCRAALESLVDIEFLTLTRSGHYARRAEGFGRNPDLQMAKAGLREKQRQQRAG